MDDHAKDERIESLRQRCRHLDAVPVSDTRRLGFVASDFKVQLRGICRDCREQEDKI